MDLPVNSSQSKVQEPNPQLQTQNSSPSTARTAHIFISTGEVSGDLQGSLLIHALNQQAKERGLDLKVTALGGDRMAAVGAKLLGHTSEIGSMGILESLPLFFQP